MKLILVLFFLISCGEKDSKYHQLHHRNMYSNQLMKCFDYYCNAIPTRYDCIDVEVSCEDGFACSNNGDDRYKRYFCQ